MRSKIISFKTYLTTKTIAIICFFTYRRMYVKIKNLEESDEIFIKYMGLQRLCNNFDGSKVECPEFTTL